jgi:hypothetical protein
MMKYVCSNLASGWRGKPRGTSFCSEIRVALHTGQVHLTLPAAAAAAAAAAALPEEGTS